MATMLATNRKRLAWRPARRKVDLSGEGGPINLPHILANERPIARVLNAIRLIQSQSGEGVGIPLDHQLVIEPGSGRTEGQAAATTE
jgi:hypothetical protein